MEVLIVSIQILIACAALLNGVLAGSFLDRNRMQEGLKHLVVAAMGFFAVGAIGWIQ